ncbi:MAG: deoxyguanosinetriphosphate triphosphohydrolase [Bacteroidota bacterium]|nr:deoxyguanosinetriphosphate triphosphohydrolase [Bacteroidota bacterium]
MNWRQLLSAERLGKEGDTKLYENEDYARSQFQRDYDRIIFSSPFRRLQNKTQVFPLPGSIFVHNRLTHSLEVASVGRSLGSILYTHLRKDPDLKDFYLLPEIGNIVSAACLAHDLGNPSFGHSGEKAISRYFTDGAGKIYQDKVSEMQWRDLTNFEGNANAFRILTHIFHGKTESLFALTYSTLSALVKYPCESIIGGNKANICQKKYGFFASETETYRKIAEKLGILTLQELPFSCYRHPLTFLVEAADDICYYIIDLEDAHRLGIFNDNDVWELMKDLLGNNDETLTRYQAINDSNDKISFLRAKCINTLITECSAIFQENLPSIMRGEFNASLIGSLPEPYQSALKKIDEISVSKVYNFRSVVEKEIAGYKVMSGLLEEFIPAVMEGNGHYHEKLRALIPSQFTALDKSPYSRIQSVLDFVSGMTDLYAVELFRKIKGISFPAV